MNQSTPPQAPQTAQPPQTGHLELPETVTTKTRSLKMPPLLGLNRFGEEFIASWTRCEPETVAQWIQEGTLNKRAREAQDLMGEEIATQMEQGATHHEAVHEATKKLLQPPLQA